MDYSAAMREASEKITILNESLMSAGFEKDAVKTTNFYIDTDYSSRKDRNGNYYKVFNGYVIKHNLKVSFDFDTELLSKALNKISVCVARPELSIRFTVKDDSAVNELLLKDAAVNARRKAEILSETSGVKLSKLLNVDYNWGELSIFSKTSYRYSDDCTFDICELPLGTGIDFEPDNIDVSDTVTFVWEIT